MGIYEKLGKIKSDIRVQQLKDDQLQQLLQQDLEQKKGVYQMNLELAVLLQLLLQSAAAASQQDQLKTKKMHQLAAWYDGIVTKLAEKLKEHMEANEKTKKLNKQMGVEKKEESAKHMEVEVVARSQGGDGDDEITEEEIRGTTEHMVPICLREVQYAHILREVFPMTSTGRSLHAQQQDRTSTAKQATMTTMTTSGGDQIKQMIQEVKQDILRELQQGRFDKNQATSCESSVPGQNGDATFEEIDKKMGKFKQELKEQLKIKGLLDEIKHHLKNECPLIILKVDEKMGESRWEDTRNALSLLECSADLLIVTTAKGTHGAKEFCYPPREPIEYSVVGRYHDAVLRLSSQQKNEDNYNSQIFRDILEECEPDEFCMKIFAHALYAKPKRSPKELYKLHSSLKEISPKPFVSIAKTMLQFSYNALSKDYRSCLMYLAIFPRGHIIRRSTLIARWVAEGLITKEDWHTSVRQAERCFDALMDQWFINPADISATGKVKSCMVGDLIHGFITKMARKENIVEASLSHHLARHFSIFNGLRLRSSDGIYTFFRNLSESSQLSLLKVLDLEGCQCFGGRKQRHLKDICTKMLLLKYLSLRATDITRLPSEINNLRELEVLDIRQTNVPASATVNILLLKLKRFLAGHINQTPTNADTTRAIGSDGLVSSVQIPIKMEKMVNMEVLSNVKVQSTQDLKDIGKLWQLRKLGVVIDDKTSHLKNLLRMISDLHECLRSLSITLPIARSEEISSGEELQDDISYFLKLRHPPNLLETLSISGTTRKVHLLPLFATYGNNRLAKVTLSWTSLNQDNLKVLAKLPRLQCVRLRHIACTQSMLIFEEGEFKYLKNLLVEGSNLTEIVFEEGAAPELEKMVLSFTSVVSVSGVGGLQKLEELELNNNNNGRLLSSFNNAKQIIKLTLRGKLLEQDALQVLAKKQNMRCLVLLHSSCELSQITFSKDDFPKLNQLIVHCSAITDIVFTGGSAPKLEKIIWSSTTLSGINNLPRLKELEFNGDLVPNEVKEAVKKHKNRPSLKHNKPEIHDQAKGDEQEDDDDAARFSFCWKNQV